MSDLTTPKKRPQRPAAPSWAARRRPRTDAADAARAAAEVEARAAKPVAEAPLPVTSPFPAPPRVPRPAGAAPPRPAEGTPPRPAGGVEASETPSVPPVSAAPSTIRPGTAPVVEKREASSEEPETVSLRDIENIVSPGKAPPPLPAGARAAGRAGGPAPAPRAIVRGGAAAPAAEPPGPPRPPFDSLDETEPVPLSSRWGDSRNSDLSAMAALVPAARPAAARNARPAPHAEEATAGTIERALPHPLDASLADLQLMAALAPVPQKKPAAAKPVWAPPKAAAQARASTVAVLSSEAAAAFKGTRPAQGAQGGPAQGAWRSAPGAAPARSPTLPSTAATNAERPIPLSKPKVLVPPPPVRVGAPQRKSVPETTDVDETAWEIPDEPAAGPARVTASATASAMPSHTAVDTRALDALAMRAGPRGSLPDPVELLRDTNLPGQASGRGSVVDPLELYGTPRTPLTEAPEHTLPKVIVQAPARPAAEARVVAETTAASAAQAATALAAAEAKAAIAIAAAEARAAAAEDALAAAEARAAAAAVDANTAALFRSRVDLPLRAEPKPFPKPPARPAAAARAPEAKDTRDGAPGAPKPAARAALRAPPPPPPKPLAAAKSAQKELEEDAAPVSFEDDEIPVDITPDPAPGTTADSGRFDLQQLMSVRNGPASSNKGLGDADLFGLAGDLFTDTSSPKLAPPDLSAPAKPLSSRPAPAGRLLAPVALAAASSAQSATASPDLEAEALRRPRAFTPWLLLPLIALVAAVVMVWLGRSPDAKDEPRPTPSQGEDPRPPVTSGIATQPSSATATKPPATEEPSPGDKPSTAKTAETSATSPAGVWKPPATATTGAATTTAPTATTPATATAPATATTAVPTATTPPAGGNEFNAAAAKSALRNAAGAAAGCPTDKPGVATVAITFAPSGRVTSSQVSGGFAGTATGGCIASAMRGATVPPFDGGPVSVSWKVTLR